MTRSFLSILLALSVMTILLPSGAEAQSALDEPPGPFGKIVNDLPPTHWAYSMFTDFIQADVVQGYLQKDGTYLAKPDDPINRAEFVTLLVQTMGLQSSGKGKTFADVKTTDWYAGPIRIASALGLISGTGPNAFEPLRPLRRDEAAVIMAGAFGGTIASQMPPSFFPDVSKSYWAYPYISRASALGIVKGDPDRNFHPQDTTKRADAVSLLYNALHKENTALPDDQTLVNVLLQNEQDFYNTFQTGNYQNLYLVNNHYGTGYFKKIWDVKVAQMINLSSKGYKIEMKPNSIPLSATVLTKNNRYAMLDLKGGFYTVLYTSPQGVLSDDPRHMYGTWHLRKMPDTGEWKAYFVLDIP